MALRVIGAGLPRTGTTSLKAALEQLTGEACYHMVEFFPRIDTHGAGWTKALKGDPSQLPSMLEEFGAAIDWPASLFWRELVDLHPNALVIMSHRASPAAWWKSVDRTVWYSMRHSDFPEWDAFAALMRTKAGFGEDWDDPDVAKAHYEALIAELTEAVPSERLLLWQPGDGWEPLCAALGADVPDEPFPRLNDTAEFRALSGWDDAEG